jgi:hypothetical protein
LTEPGLKEVTIENLNVEALPEPVARAVQGGVAADLLYGFGHFMVLGHCW